MSRPSSAIEIIRHEGREQQNCSPELLSMLGATVVRGKIYGNPLEDVTLAAYTRVAKGASLAGAMTINLYPHLSANSQINNLTPGFGRSLGIHLSRGLPYGSWPSVMDPLLTAAEDETKAHGIHYLQVTANSVYEADYLADHGYDQPWFQSSAWEKPL
jgi:hypothetical protein